MRLQSIAMLLVCLPGCSLQQPTAEERFAQQALQAVRNSMKDPTSVKFKDVMVVGPARCALGEALGKNSFGAYAGYQRFVYINGEVVFHEPGAVTDLTKSRDDAMKYINKSSDCSRIASNTLAEHLLHISGA